METMQEASAQSNRRHRTPARAAMYGGLAGFLFALPFIVPASALMSAPELRASLGTTLAVLAVVGASMALVRHRSRPNDTLLLVGAGLAVLAASGGLSVMAISGSFTSLSGSEPQALAEWSWLAGRLILGACLVGAWALGMRERRTGQRDLLPEKAVALATLGTVALGAVLLLGMRLPPATGAGSLPGPELLTGALFVVAAGGFLQRGRWRHWPFEVALIAGLMLFAGASLGLATFAVDPTDPRLLVARLLEIAGLGFVVSGMLASMHGLYMGMERDRKALNGMVAALERSNEDLRQFASVASHDLQEPLRVVGGYGRLVVDRYGDRLDERGQELLGRTIDGVERMQRLIDDLLRYARLETDGRDVAPVPSAEPLEWAMANLESAMEEVDGQVLYDALPIVRADRAQLGQIFQNLIANALRFRSGRRPIVRVTAERRRGEWVIQVRDNGIGIPPGERERVFDVFRRLGDDEPDSTSGSGMGLAICKRIVERHGGRIWIESEPGEGTTVCFVLPPATVRPEVVTAA